MVPTSASAIDSGGTRASGTPGYDASVQYVARTLRRSGYSVKIQEFTFPFYRELASGVFRLEPTEAEYETKTFEYSGGGDVTGPIVPIDVLIPPTGGSTSGCELSDFPTAPAEPAIALVQRGTCTFEAKADNALAAGYEAVIIFNEGNDPGRVALFEGTLSAPKTIPVLGLSYADGAALYAATQAGPVTGRAFAEVEVDLERETYNVIADSPRGKNTDEVVVVGAHLDSVIAGPGIYDNGSGSSTILEIAQEMAELKYTKKGALQRQVRFAFWGAEESGLLGSEFYVANLTDAQQARLYANLNFDMVGSPNCVRFGYEGSDSTPAGPPGSGAIEKIFTDYFASQGLESEPTQFSGRSDCGPFIAVGVPAGVAYDACSTRPVTRSTTSTPGRFRAG